MKEVPVAFRSKGEQVAGMLHLPDKRNAPVVIMHHGWNSNKIGPNRLFVLAAREFTKRGFAVLRYDARGCGDSEGSFEDQTLQSQLEDLDAALDHLGNCRHLLDTAKIGIIGHSQGGKIAILFAARDKRIKCIDSWAGAPKMMDFWSEVHFRELNEKGYFYSSWYGVCQKKKSVMQNMKFEKKHDVLREIKKARCPIQITSGSHDADVPLSTAKLLYKNANKPKKLNIIKGADHFFNLKNHRSRLIKSSLAWFRKWLR